MFYLYLVVSKPCNRVLVYWRACNCVWCNSSLHALTVVQLVVDAVIDRMPRCQLLSCQRTLYKWRFFKVPVNSYLIFSVVILYHHECRLSFSFPATVLFFESKSDPFVFFRDPFFWSSIFIGDIDYYRFGFPSSSFFVVLTKKRFLPIVCLKQYTLEY